ncbi:MAG: hypothetical protein KKH41_04660 [Candidatus Thermoplasmatota archaeon]|nr:hypothetical protein [Euryarchaeota archaeon]MBU4144025.1 hypothetical protein [Candidatus Thermoplasmatota archaeon]MBU4591861.1 hypothetical protein [Candidatus Thermoplasmatota archaeon]
MEKETEVVWCNTCGNEMHFHNNEYHCTFCEQKDVFWISKTENCIYSKDEAKCGKIFGAVPRQCLDIIGTKHSIVMRMPFEWYCKECRLKDNSNEKGWDSVANCFGMDIARGDKTPNQFLMSGLPEKFVELCIEKSRKYK